MKLLRTLLPLLIVVLAACGGGGGQTTQSPAAVPTSNIAAVTTDQPEGTPAPADTAVTQVANEEVTPESETVDINPESETPVTSELPSGGGTATGEWDCGDRERLGDRLAIFSWADYWPVEPDNNLLQEFEAACGVQVTLDTFPSNEDLAARLRAGNAGYDIVVPSDYMVEILSQEGRLMKLDTSLLPNMANLDPEQMGLYYDPDNEYSIPYQYGLTGIAYNSAEVDPAPTGWAALFDTTQLEPYRNSASMLDDERESVGAALQYLGYSVNSTNPDELTQARDLLLQQKPLLARYDSQSVAQGLASGEIVLAHAWNGEASFAKEENPDIEWILPEDGGVIWQDTLAIPADAPNAYAAHVFINNILDGVIGARITEFTYFLTPNLAAEPLVSEEVRDLMYYPDEQMRERVEYIERRGDPALYSDIWTQVKGG